MRQHAVRGKERAGLRKGVGCWAGTENAGHGAFLFCYLVFPFFTHCFNPRADCRPSIYTGNTCNQIQIHKLVVLCEVETIHRNPLLTDPRLFLACFAWVCFAIPYRWVRDLWLVLGLVPLFPSVVQSRAISLWFLSLVQWDGAGSGWVRAGADAGFIDYAYGYRDFR